MLYYKHAKNNNPFLTVTIPLGADYEDEHLSLTAGECMLSIPLFGGSYTAAARRTVGTLKATGESLDAEVTVYYEYLLHEHEITICHGDFDRTDKSPPAARVSELRLFVPGTDNVLLSTDAHKVSPLTSRADCVSGEAVATLREGLGRVYELIKQTALDRGICVSEWRNLRNKAGNSLLNGPVKSEIDTPNSKFYPRGSYFYNKIGTTKDPKPNGYAGFSWIDVYEIELNEIARTCVSQSLNLARSCTRRDLIGGHTGFAVGRPLITPFKIRRITYYYTYSRYMRRSQIISPGVDVKCFIVPICRGHNGRDTIVMRTKSHTSALRLTDFGY